VKTSSQLEKPHYGILGFQTKRQNKPDKNASHFDHVQLRDVKMNLNSQCYPYGNLNLDITKKNNLPFFTICTPVFKRRIMEKMQNRSSGDWWGITECHTQP